MSSISHSRPVDAQFQAINDHLESLFTEARGLDATTAEGRRRLIAIAAESHYILASTMPYHRGSAAIADAYARSLFEMHGITMPRFDPGIIPDLLAFSMTQDDYIKAYPSWLDGK